MVSTNDSVGRKPRHEASASNDVIVRKWKIITQAVFDSYIHPTSSVGWTERCGPDHGRRGGGGADERGCGASIVSRESDDC